MGGFSASDWKRIVTKPLGVAVVDGVDRIVIASTVREREQWTPTNLEQNGWHKEEVNHECRRYPLHHSTSYRLASCGNGPIPHSEVTAMIASAKDGDGITSRERAELLAAVAMFGDTVPGRPSLLSPADEAALKAAAISGIETLDLFLGQSRAKQESFIVYCVLQGSAEYIGFTQLYTPPGSGDLEVVAYELTGHKIANKFVTIVTQLAS